ncbi:SRPBCC domain-containing protein [Devosia aurantiaca]|uniref:ATPase n=1 Tax=Devosia aurantiaca TaxID=2714858 RepID=A0A6M1SGK6_9HYPH|nr:SRPBCC domain-containing protein [Devosia aurantiaca]NGP18597.1 ATPase [Devosia aurantiaca]
MNDKPMDSQTVVRRVSDTEVAVTRTFDAPARVVFKAWSNAELFAKWWVPKSLGATLRSCEMDVRTGGTYRLEFGESAETSFAFHGKYIDVVPSERIVWSNEESEDGAVSTVTFVEKDGKTHLTFSETYPSKEALEANQGGLDGAPEQFEQLDALLPTLS